MHLLYSDFDFFVQAIPSTGAATSISSLLGEGMMISTLHDPSYTIWPQMGEKFEWVCMCLCLLVCLLACVGCP